MALTNGRNHLKVDIQRYMKTITEEKALSHNTYKELPAYPSKPDSSHFPFTPQSLPPNAASGSGKHCKQTNKVWCTISLSDFFGHL